MEIKSLYERIKAQIQNQSFSLSEATTQAEALGRLCAVFRLESLLLQEVFCMLNGDVLDFGGTFSLSSIDTPMQMDIKVTGDGRVRAAVSAPQANLDAEGHFCTQNFMVTLALQENGADFSEQIEGTLSFGGIDFSISSNRTDMGERRQLQVQCAKGMDAADLINAALGLLGMDLSLFGTGQTQLFQIQEFCFFYTADSEWLTASKQNVETFDDYFEMRIRTDIGFSFGDMFSMNNLGFAFEKYGSEFDFSMDGEIDILGGACSFFMSYGSERFAVSLSQCEKAAIGSMEDMGILIPASNEPGSHACMDIAGVLIEEKRIASYFPDEFKPSGGIQLHTMNFDISSDFKKIERFAVVVLLDYKWQLCESQQIMLSDILVSFSYEFGDKSFGICGNLQFGELSTRLYAGVLASETSAVWCFKWKLYEEETVSLTTLIGQLAHAIGVDSPRMKLPDIEIGNVGVKYAAGTFSMGLEIVVTKSKLFSSRTNIQITSSVKDGKRDFEAAFSWESLEQGLTVKTILEECGAGEAVAEIPACIQNIGLKSVELSYDFLEGKISSDIEIVNIGTVTIEIAFQGEKEYAVSFVPCLPELSFADIPVVGGLVQQFVPSKGKFAISDLALHVRSKPCEEEQLLAGLVLVLSVLGERKVCMISGRQPEKRAYMLEEQNQQVPKTVWLNIDKKIAICSLHRLGVGFDGEYLMFAVDAQFNVSPLTFVLAGAGIGVCLSDPANVKCYISGFGVSFQNELLSISGEFVNAADAYVGELLIRVRQISAVAIAEYAKDGSLMAFAAVMANFGGPPALFVTGVAFGFGYHKQLILPDMEGVADYPLIEAAKGRFSREDLADRLKAYFVSEKGQKFLAAGIRFTSFGIMDSVAILTVSFGNEFEIGLLGLSELTMPPKSKKSPIAYAALALRAMIKPKEGVLSVEARLTSESYILSRDCKLSGGFALYYWFGGANSGDMVITLGGYKSDYQKPEHYPDVPRVMFQWKIGDHLQITGEMYFALTPKEVMAGGRLNAVYSLGKLKAYFIAAADFYLGWKPFAYEASLQVLVGASYRVDFLFVHHTFSIELGAGLHIWGPDFAGTAHISWFIISFDIHFGQGSPHSDEGIGWQEFADSFLPVDERKRVGMEKENSQTSITNPLTISYPGGVTAAEEKTLCRADALQISVESAIPLTKFAVNQSAQSDVGQTLCVQPMKEAKLENCLQVELQDESGQHVNVKTSFLKKHVPSALWGKKDGPAVVPNVVCGIVLVPEHVEYVLFPVNHFISMESLYLLGTIVIRDAFSYMDAGSYPSYTTQGSLQIVSDTMDADEVQQCRKEFLRQQGIDIGEISLKKYAANARNLLSEYVMVKE